MSGTINLSLTQQLDEFGAPLSGGQLYFIQAGTVSTPQNAFVDGALTIPLPNPVTLDAAGRIPQFFLADGQIKVRLQDAAGVVKFVADNLLVIGASSGGGGGGSVDPTTVWQTGDLKARYDTAVIAGFVRANGRTIGPASSSATELAHASAQQLFQHLWQVDSSLNVTPGGRGATAAADWATGNKVIELPDGRNKLLMALADMGNTNTGNLASVLFAKGNATTLGSIIGSTRVSIDSTRLPAHQHNVFLRDPGHTHPFGAGGASNAGGSSPGGGPSVSGTGTATIAPATTGMTIGSVAGVANDNKTANTGGGLGFNVEHIANPAMLITVYIKL